ncbi:MAG TPA: hypothetical protein VE871_07930 [Longimicrobium sp.]|nr:hypothetical protein [Longimicrobium sp.]
MKLSSRAARALLVLAATAAPARALAQEAEAWVLPRGLLELSGGGVFSNYDSRLGFGDPPLGVEFTRLLQSATERVTGPAEAAARARVTDLFAGTTDPDPASSPLPASLAVGTVALRVTGDERTVPFTLRYGLSDRLTVSLLIPIERRGTSVSGPYLTGGTLGLNPNRAANAAVLGDIGYGDLGGGLLLPVAGTPAAVELQARLRAINPADTLALPGNPVTVAELLENEATSALLTAPEARGFGLASARRPYHLGDLQLGARFLLRRGPAGWPFPDSVNGRSLRTSVGARVRLPTGRSGTRFFSEIPPRGGHFGAGVDVLNDVFISSRWYVNASASLDVLFPADVPRLAFSAEDPFPADSAQRIVRSAPGPRLAASITPRWRLTDEISFSGEYALLAQRRTEYSGGPDGLGYSPVEWRTGGSMHALGVGAHYSSLQAFARGRARVPFEISLSVSRAVVGGGAAPQAATVRVAGRVFMDPRVFARFLPGDPPPADTTAPLAVPSAGPTDTLPSQVRPEVPVGPRIVVPPQPDTTAGDSTPPRVLPPAPSQASAVVHEPTAPRHALAYPRRSSIAPARRWAAAAP